MNLSLWLYNIKCILSTNFIIWFKLFSLKYVKIMMHLEFSHSRKQEKTALTFIILVLRENLLAYLSLWPLILYDWCTQNSVYPSFPISNRHKMLQQLPYAFPLKSHTTHSKHLLFLQQKGWHLSPLFYISE